MKSIHTILRALPFFFFLHEVCEGRSRLNGDPRASTRFIPKIKKDSPVFNLRGGAVSPKTVAATSIAALNAVYGGSVMLAPARTLRDAFKIEEVTPLDELMAVNSGLSMVSGAFLIGSVLFAGIAPGPAIGGTVAVPCLVRSLCSIFAKQNTVGMGYFGASAYMDSALFAFCSYATLIDSSMADAAMKVVALWHLLTGLLLFLYPSGYASVKAESAKQQVTAKPKGGGKAEDMVGFVTFMARNYGNNMLVAGIAFSLLARGSDLIQALGYGWMYGAFGIILMTYVSKELPKFVPNARGAVIFWIVVMGGLGLWAVR